MKHIFNGEKAHAHNGSLWGYDSSHLTVFWPRQSADIATLPVCVLGRGQDESETPLPGGQFPAGSNFGKCPGCYVTRVFGRGGLFQVMGVIIDYLTWGVWPILLLFTVVLAEAN